MRQYCVYIMSNQSRTLYTGVAGNLERRVYEHKMKVCPGLTKKYHIDRLVFYEMTPDAQAAITREKQIKGWTRTKKISLIEVKNPEWQDLAEDWFPNPDSSGLRPSE